MKTLTAALALLASPALAHEIGAAHVHADVNWLAATLSVGAVGLLLTLRRTLARGRA